MNIDDNEIANKGLGMVLECDKQMKEERIKYERENII